MLKHNRLSCTAETVGTVAAFRHSGGVSAVIVQYRVNGSDYAVEESLKLRSEWIRIGFLPIGQRKTRRLHAIDGSAVRVGSIVRIHYDPNRPEKAYLTDNVGVMNA